MKEVDRQNFIRGAKCFLVLLSITLILPACSPANATAPGTVVDDLGRSVNIEEIPQSVISLAPSNTEILFALGLGEKVVGVTEHCNYPLEALNKPKIGGFATPDIEKIIALQPDLVLAAEIHVNEVIPALEGIGFPVFTLEPKNVAGMLADIKMVGKITGKEREASKLVSEIESKIKVVTDKTKDLKPEEKPRVFFITWHAPLWSVGSGTTIQEIIEKAGGVNIAQSITGHNTIDIETVIAHDPEVIIACTGHGEAEGEPFEWAKEEPRLSVTKARKNNRVYQIDADLVNRTGPRIVDALEEFALFIHPEIFGKPKGG